jgi:hypothetical protein
MMVKVRLVEVEGDPEEVMRVSKLFGASAEPQKEYAPVTERSERSQEEIPHNGRAVTPELVLRVLTRRELHTNVKKALKALLRAGPKGLTSEELAKAVGIDRGQLAGVLGAFGRRIANTKGWPDSAKIIDRHRDETGRKRYQFSPVVRAALEKFDLS